MAENVLLPNEIEFFISNMTETSIEDIGTKHWVDWHLRLQRLNQQAVLEATELRDESVKETLVSYNKIGILVYEAVLIQVWRTKILPRLLKLQPEPENTFFIYSVLYHEATAVSLLETTSYHAESCAILNDVALDLLDYTYNAINKMINLKNTWNDTPIEEVVINIERMYTEEFPRQRDTLLFDIGMRSISILFHIIVNIDR